MLRLLSLRQNFLRPDDLFAARSDPLLRTVALVRSFLSLSLGVFSWNFGGVGSAGALKCARLEFSGCRVKPRPFSLSLLGAENLIFFCASISLRFLLTVLM